MPIFCTKAEPPHAENALQSDDDDSDSSAIPSETTSKKSHTSEWTKRGKAGVMTEGMPTVAKFKKPTQAPKSAFIFFSIEKHKEIRAQLGEEASLAAKVSPETMVRMIV